MRQIRPTALTVDIGVVKRNIELLRTKLNPGVKMLAVVKANAYGHGAVHVARAALDAGCYMVAVALHEEGIELREAGIDCPILVLGGANDDGARAAVDYALDQAVCDIRTMRAMCERAREAGKPALMHIKFDAGMGRIGVRTEDELRALLNEIKRWPEARVDGVFMHFPRADEDAEELTRSQFERFTDMVSIVRGYGFTPIAHAANSAALERYPWTQLDMVRAGVAMYGYAPFMPGLRYAQTWTTRPLFEKTIPAGATVSYGGDFVSKRDTRVLTLPVGYCDGYLRAFNNKAQVLICGKRANVLGRVCMDQIMIDVTDIPGAGLDSEVVLMGAQGDDRITPEELADIAGTIPYEIMLGTHSRVPVVYK